MRYENAQSIDGVSGSTTSETDGVIAATKRAPKKRKPTTRPAGPMVSKAPGMLMNRAPTVLSPTSPDRPRAKMSGKTSRPARKAIPKSETAIVIDSRGRFSSFDR
jgi:hypothetical protein